jgi:hypothetical protein
MSEKKKNFALRFIQIAWVIETMALIIYSMVAVICFTPERNDSWRQLVQPLAGLIAAQGAAAGLGPLASDKINRPPEGKSA